jgi:hypothetical protein
MESRVKRTLVKSAPELWVLADDPARMKAWMADLVGSQQPVSVEVTDREPERALAWRANGIGGEPASIAIALAEGGFGTAVEITAVHPQPDPGPAPPSATLERLLDELGAAERRPFSRA